MPSGSASTRCGAGTAQGRIRVERDDANRRVVPAAEVERLRGARPRRALGAEPLPRRRARGPGRRAARAGRDRRHRAGAHRRASSPATPPRSSAFGPAWPRRRREGDLRDGRAMKAILCSPLRGRRSAAGAGARRRGGVAAPARPRRRLADGGLPAHRRAAGATASPARTSSRSRSARARRPTSSPRRAPSSRRPSSATASSSVRSASRRTRSCSSCRRENPAGVRSVFDLRRKDVSSSIGGARVPIGVVHARGPAAAGALAAVLAKVVSQEPDVKGIVDKVALGQADAGFVYATDARAADRRAASRSPCLRARSRRCATRSRSSRGARTRPLRAPGSGRLRAPRAQRLLREAGFGPSGEPRPRVHGRSSRRRSRRPWRSSRSRSRRSSSTSRRRGCSTGCAATPRATRSW